MRKWINRYFNFTKSEFNGILALFILIVLIIVLPRIYFHDLQDEPEVGKMPELERLELEAQFKKKLPFNRSSKPKSWKKVLKLTAFDPNTLDQRGWETLGLSQKQAQAILNYVAKGGKFNKAEDLKKMYTISSEVYSTLLPYVKIANTHAPIKESRYPAVKYVKKPLIIYEMNSLDTIAMQAINGIGPAFARRIFKYRERLGGFHNPEQLLEVFGIDSAHYAIIYPQIKIDGQAVKKININTAGFDDLKQHPYLRYKQVNAMIEYRKQHGNYSNFEDLKKVVILPAETVDRLAPYRSF